MSKECLLRCQQDGKVMEKILFEKSRVYIKTPDKNNHCSYQAVLTSLHQYISDLEGFHKYTAVHSKDQLLIHLKENLPNTELMNQIFTQAWYKIMCPHSCPKVLHSKEWSDARSMLGLIIHMWKIKITLINYMGYDVEFVVFGPYEGEGHADIYIIYVVPPQSWGDRSDTKYSKCLLLGDRRLNQLTLIPKPKGSGGARAATAQVGPANKRNDTKRCLPVEASLRPGEAVPW